MDLLDGNFWIQIIIAGIKQFFVVAIAVWILTGVLSKIPGVAKITKEILAYIIGIGAISAGYFTGLFEGHFLIVYAFGIISIAVAQIVYTKFIKTIADKLVSNIKQ